MRKIKIFFLLLLPLYGFSQGEFLSDFSKAELLLQLNKVDSAYVKFKNIEKTLTTRDTLYEYVLWYRTLTASHLEEVNRFNENFEESLRFGLDALDGIEKGKEIFDDEFAELEYFMVKNLIVSYYGIGNFEEGNKWKAKMYKAKEKNLLPEGLDEYFNFDFFRIEDKNIWGYEWFDELPENRFSTSFTKVVYYVYSTYSDGSDKDQLYRLHVLMFHGNNPDFDYVMDKRLESATEEVAGTLYAYTYKEDIDFEKLQKDVKQVIKGDLQPDTRRITTKNDD